MSEVYRQSTSQFVKDTFGRAIERLLEEKELDSITISEILKESGLSRSTFYKYFKDKYELTCWRFCELHYGNNKEPSSVDAGDQNISNMVHFVADHKSIYKKLFKYHGQNNFYDFFKQFCDDFIEHVARKSNRSLSTREKYINIYHCMGSLEVLKEWVLSSDDSLDAEDILQIIIGESRSDSVRELYIVKEQ